MYVDMYTRTYACVYMHMCIPLSCVCACVCICVCMYLCVFNLHSTQPSGIFFLLFVPEHQGLGRVTCKASKLKCSSYICFQF